MGKIRGRVSFPGSVSDARNENLIGFLHCIKFWEWRKEKRMGRTRTTEKLKLRRKKVDVATIAEKLAQVEIDYCTCPPEYYERYLTSPYCTVHEICEELREFLEIPDRDYDDLRKSCRNKKRVDRVKGHFRESFEKKGKLGELLSGMNEL